MPERDPKGHFKSWRPSGFEGLELNKVTTNLSFQPRHIHEAHQIGLILRGGGQFHYRGAHLTTTAGCLAIVQAGEAHSCYTNEAEGWSYGILYVGPKLLAKLVSELTGKTLTAIHFSSLVFERALLARLVRNLFNSLEQSQHLRPKVRLRAQVVRLNAAGWSRRRIAHHTGRTYGTVGQDLKRWHRHGVEGLADAPATNQPEKLTQEMRKLVLEKLQEERTWTCRQLVEVVANRFGIKVSVEAMRKRVRGLGYCWKRTRYVPCKEVNAKVEREHRASLETLKRGPKKGA